MPRRPRTIPGPSRLSGILAQLTKQPRLELSSELKSLKVSYKSKNGDFGARYFVKEELPRIRYANPALEIQVDKLFPNRSDPQPPTMVLAFANSSPKTLLLSQKWSTTILNELMASAGSPLWSKWVGERTAAGENVLPGQESYVKKPRVWKTSMKPRDVKRKVEALEGDGQDLRSAEEVTKSSTDDLKELLGLGDTTPSDIVAETDPLKSGVAAALP